VNRCITEGRRSFLDRVAGIESGAECRRLAPLLSRLVDGEATPEDMATLRPHLRSCLACRATLRDFRETPARIAAFAPLLVTPGLFARALHRLHHVLSWSGATKAATVVAVTAAVAGGGIAALHGGKPNGHHKPPKPTPHHRPVRHHPKHPPPVAHIAMKKHHTVGRHRKPQTTPKAPAPVSTPAPAPAPIPTPRPTSLPTSEFGP
jgi:hypothetical protein